MWKRRGWFSRWESRPGDCFTIINIVMCISFQQGWKPCHTDFDNAFYNRPLERPVYFELLEHMYGQTERNEWVVKLSTFLYVLKNAARTKSELLYSKFKRLGIKKVRSALSVFVKSALNVMCNVYDLLIFLKTNDDIKTFQNQIWQVLKIKYLEKRRQLLGV